MYRLYRPVKIYQMSQFQLIHGRFHQKNDLPFPVGIPVPPSAVWTTHDPNASWSCATVLVSVTEISSHRLPTLIHTLEDPPTPSMGKNKNILWRKFTKHPSFQWISDDIYNYITIYDYMMMLMVIPKYRAFLHRFPSIDSGECILATSIGRKWW